MKTRKILLSVLLTVMVIVAGVGGVNIIGIFDDDTTEPIRAQPTETQQTQQPTNAEDLSCADFLKTLADTGGQSLLIKLANQNGAIYYNKKEERKCAFGYEEIQPES